MAKSASPSFLIDIYRKVAVRYVFMAEDLLRRAKRPSARCLWDYSSYRTTRILKNSS
jgi:hypothetical protein